MSFIFIDENKTCCFTGPRPEKIFDDFDEIKQATKFAIITAYNEGYCYFLSGMSRGFDIISATCVLELQKDYEIQLFATIPFWGQEERWCEHDRNIYENILEKSSQVFCVSDKFERGAYHKRNRFMVEKSTKIITYYDNSEGGTKYTLDYARKMSKNIINIYDRQILIW